MRRFGRAWLALVAVAAIGLVSVVVAAAAQPEGQPPTEVLKWNRLAYSTLLQPPMGTLPPPAGGAPSAANIHLAMTQGAVYDAVNAIEPKHYRPYLLERRFSARASEDAAVATAAYEVLSSIVRGVPQSITFPNRQALLDTLSAAYDESLDGIDDSPFKAQGIAAGHAAAEAMIAAREDDGRYGPSQWVGAPGGDLSKIPIGHWSPVLPDGTTVAQDPTPWVGGVKPFVIESSSQFRSAGPNSLTSAAYTADYNEVKALGGDGIGTPTTRNADQTRTALFWTGAGGPFWSVVARDLIEDLDLDLAAGARLLAMMNVSAADAVINCWNDKYHFDLWRPWNAIPRALEDGNPDTAPQAGWTPLRSAPYPEHPSGHMCLDGANIGALQHFFGTDTFAFDVSSFVITDHPNHYDHFSEPLDEIEDARVWSGLHFRTGDEQGRKLGENVADYVAEHAFQKVGKAD
jgi:hypothetical protein